MTEETQAPATAQEQSPALTSTEQETPKAQTDVSQQATEQQKTEAAVKAQEMGKKITGFLGGLAEKAKNIDMKELAEKAKNIDVKELTEKAKQKVNEVKDKAAEINAGKTDDVVTPREQISADQMKDLIGKAGAEMIENVPPVVQALLADVAQGEQIVAKLKFGTAPESVYVALSSKSFYCFSKSSDQFLCDIYFLDDLHQFSLLPPRAETPGRMTLVTSKEEIKLLLGSMDNYAKSLILYKKIREFIGK